MLQRLRCFEAFDLNAMIDASSHGFIFDEMREEHQVSLLDLLIVSQLLIHHRHLCLILLQ